MRYGASREEVGADPPFICFGHYWVELGGEGTGRTSEFRWIGIKRSLLRVRYGVCAERAVKTFEGQDFLGPPREGRSSQSLRLLYYIGDSDNPSAAGFPLNQEAKQKPKPSGSQSRAEARQPWRRPILWIFRPGSRRDRSLWFSMRFFRGRPTILGMQNRAYLHQILKPTPGCFHGLQCSEPGPIQEVLVGAARRSCEAIATFSKAQLA